MAYDGSKGVDGNGLSHILGKMWSKITSIFQTKVTGGATSILDSNLTVNRALQSDSSGKVSASDVSAKELGYLKGVTGGIQQQLLSKVPTAAIQQQKVEGNVGSALYSAAYCNSTLDEGKMNSYVVVDGTRRNTQAIYFNYGDGIAINWTAAEKLEFSLRSASPSELGGVKVPYTNTGAVTPQSKSTTADRYYGVELDKNGLAVVNVPWMDHVYSGSGTIDVDSTGKISVKLGNGLEEDANGGLKLSDAIGEALDGKLPTSAVKNTKQTGSAASTNVVYRCDYINSNMAPLASPSFSGTPKAPTAAKGTNTTQLATTAYVVAAVSDLATAVDAIGNQIAAIEGKERRPLGAGESLPSEGDKGVIYMVPKTVDGRTYYEEWYWVNLGTTQSPSWGWEKMGDSDIQLAGYVKKTDFLTNSELDEIFAGVVAA